MTKYDKSVEKVSQGRRPGGAKGAERDPKESPKGAKGSPKGAKGNQKETKGSQKETKREPEGANK